MRWPWNKKPVEKKAGDSLVQYGQMGYFLGISGSNTQRLKDYIQGYKLCDTVYSCVNMIVQSAVLVPWYVYRPTADGDQDEVEKHPLVEWMKKPGLGMDWTEYLTRAVSFYLLAGNSYTHHIIGSFGQYGQVEVLLPQWMTPKSDKDGKLGYFEYRLRDRIINLPADQVMHVKAFNPENPLIGLSPVQVLSRKIDMVQFGELWTIALLENQCQPSMVLTNEAQMGEEGYKRLQQMLKDEYSGYDNAGKPLLLTGGKWSAEKMSFSPKEVEFLQSKRALMREICAAYKVAPELFGDNENKTYSNIKEARKALYQEAVIPLLGKFKAALNAEIVPLFDKSGVFLDYDVSGIDALSEDLDSKWKRVLDAKNSGTITRGEAREEMGYGELPGVDVLTEPISLVPTPVNELGKKPKPKPDEETPPKRRLISVKSGFWQKEERKRAKWEAFNRRTLAKSKSLERIAQAYLNEQAERIAKKVKKAPALNMIDRWLVMDKEKEAGLFVDAAIRWYIDSFRRAIRTGVAAGKGEIFDGEAKDTIFTPEHERDLRNMILKSGTKISETTMLEIMDMLELAEENAWTVGDLAKAIETEMVELNRMRSARIARTEAAKVENYGQLEGFRQTEFVELKGWLCAYVELSRESHKAADVEYGENPIPLDDDFVIGDDHKKMTYPGDPRGGPENVCNCLCDITPYVKEA